MGVGSDRVTAAAWLCCAAWMLSGCGGGGGGGGGTNTAGLPTITLTANPMTVQSGSTSQLTWTANDASSCTASGGWSGPQPLSGTASTGALTAATTFTLSCSGSGGTAQASVTVTVPQLTFSAAPQFVRTGVSSTLSWSSSGVNGCAASGAWSGSRPTNGSESVGPITQTASYTLSCQAAGGIQISETRNVAFRAGTNQLPNANAGADQTVPATATVNLNASFSADDNGIAAFGWTQTSGSAVALNGADAMQASFPAPAVTADTVLTFTLTVTDDEGASATDTVDITVQPIPPMVTISGDINYETVPHGPPGTGLNYSGLGFVTSDAGILVEVLNAQTQAVLASGPVRGHYAFEVPSQTDVVLRATALLSRQAPRTLPHWQISVRDLDAAGGPIGAVYSHTGPTFSSGAGVTRNLDIPSGWNNSGQLVGARAAAPFAILDAIQRALDRVSEAIPNSDFPPLTIDWGPSNDGGSTFYLSHPDDDLRRIVLTGEADVDTDEYDAFVILHEFGHYIEDSFGRDDSIGGSHALGDRLDLRVAFSEGFATAFAGMVLRQSIYRDSFGVRQGNEGFADIEIDRSDDGWFSEASIQELLWDVFDNVNDGADNVGVDLRFILEALRTAQPQTVATTSVFPFMRVLKQQLPAQAPPLDALLAAENIVGPTMDDFGSTETNNAGSADVLPIYGEVALGGTVQVHSTNQFGTGNKLATHRFLRMRLASAANVRFDVTAAAGKDPDIQIFDRGVQLAPDMGPADESFTLSLAAGDYVLDVYECGNADCNDSVTPGPVDITVSVTPN